MKRQRRLDFEAPIVGEVFCLVGVVTRRPVSPRYRVARDGSWEVISPMGSNDAEVGFAPEKGDNDDAA